MQYTVNYNLNLPEGTDIVNPLVQDNPNYTAIDSALYANKLRVIGTASEIATGTVHALTRSDTDIPVFRFVATADYNTGDTFTVDGVSVTARRADGALMKNKAYVINSTVLCILDGSILNFIGIDGKIGADDVPFDNSGTNISATDVEGAIKEVNNKVQKLSIEAGGSSISRTAGSWSYQNITFNTPFTSVPLVSVSAPFSTDMGTTMAPMLDNITTTGFRIGYYDGAGSVSVRWQAIGFIS